MRRYAIFISIFIALVLQITPMPAVADSFRPDWVLLVLAYWTLALPHRVNIGIAFLVGIVMDVLLGTVIGVHSFALSLSIFILAANYQRLRNYSLWQQAVGICLVSALYNLIVFWLQHLLTDIPFIINYLWPVATSTILWPWLFLLLRKVRHQVKIS